MNKKSMLLIITSIFLNTVSTGHAENSTPNCPGWLTREHLEQLDISQVSIKTLTVPSKSFVKMVKTDMKNRAMALAKSYVADDKQEMEKMEPDISTNCAYIFFSNSRDTKLNKILYSRHIIEFSPSALTKKTDQLTDSSK